MSRLLPAFCSIVLLLAMRGTVLADTNAYKILVFSKTAGYRHSSIPNGVAAIQALGTTNNFVADATEDASAFNDANLQQYKAVVFLSTTGEVLDTNQQASFERFIQAGHGYAGVHAASDGGYTWPWYGELVGAYFNGHPSIQEALIKVADLAHPSSSVLPKQWVRTDEWYNFDHNPRGAVHVLATLDENSYSGGGMGFDHPTVWCHEFDGGRAWYTGGGHTEESYTEPLFLAHLLGGIQYAAGVKAGDGSATIWSKFQRVILDTDLTEPMELCVAQDGRVFYIERGGKLKIYKPQTSSSVIAGQLSVFNQLEDGLLGITLDRGFATNNWLYLMYSPADASIQRVSRFTIVNDSLLAASEKILLEIPTQREQCCHSAGSLTTDTEGNLLISTGDNTNPFEASGFAPLDQRPGRSAWDSEKSASNANDLRGKILRIHPKADGTYSIPSGNLFSPTNTLTKPEIYIMGCRNPFRMSVDSETGWLYWGDVGPDAYHADSLRGPAGYDEWNQARSAGNYGWPYFIGPNLAYRAYDFGTDISGAEFNPAAPINTSPNNTGPTVLPAAQPAWIWYPYGASAEFPELGDANSRTAFAGPVYHFDANLNSTRKFPAYYDKTLFLYDMWRGGAMYEVKQDDQGQVLKINPFFKDIAYGSVEMEFGPDGAMYLLEWGPSYYLTRIDYVGGNYAPVAVATVSTNCGATPLSVEFSGGSSYAIGTNPALTYAWSFLGNGTIDSTNASASYTYTQAGNYNAQLTVTDAAGHRGVANLSITVGNHRPAVAIDYPPNGSFFNWSQPIRYAFNVSDVEDNPVACGEILGESWLGHNEHAHSQAQFHACSGVFTAPAFDPTEIGNLYLRLDASYTDHGAAGVASLKGLTTYTLQPKRKQAEYFTSSSGVVRKTTGDPTGGFEDVADIDHGDWISFTPMNLTNITSVGCRFAGHSGGTVEIHSDSPTGPLLGTINIPANGGVYTNAAGSVTNPGGTHEVFFVFVSTPGTTDLFVLNALDFIGAGVTVPVTLQSAGSINGSFSDEPSAVMDLELHTITMPITGNARFYRIRSTAPLVFTDFKIIAGKIVMSY